MKRSDLEKHQRAALKRMKAAGLTLPDPRRIEIADLGLGEYRRTGLALYLKCNEREYCSKWMALEPGQACPAHHHREKKETFFVLAGTVRLKADGEVKTLKPGGSVTISPGVVHEFTSRTGAVIEEVSTHDENSDSYFVDKRIVRDTKVEEE